MDGFKKAAEVLEANGGAFTPLPDGRLVVLAPVVRKGRLARVEVRVYNRTVASRQGAGTPPPERG